MANTFLSLLFAGAIVSAAAVQVGFAPAATSYIYRNDHNGPASLIDLGHGYQQPHAFAAPIPIAQPLKYTEAFDLAPAQLPYIADKAIVVEDLENDDDSDEGSEEYGDLGNLEGHSFEKGAGSDYGEKHHAAHGEKGSKGYNSKGHHAKGASGHYGKEHKEGHYNEAKGENGEHHSEADAHGKHHESGESYKGGDHGHKKHFSKGEEVTGYHKVFNKDEFKKDHDFYDVADNSGHFNKHGYEKENHGSEEGGHKEGGLHKSGFNKGGFGETGFHSKGHLDDAEAGHSAEAGHESHYHNDADFGKKGGSSHEKEYVYEDDDEEDDDDDDKHY